MKNKFIKGFAVCSAVALASMFGAASCEKPVGEFSIAGYSMSVAKEWQYGKTFNYQNLPFAGKLTNGKNAIIKFSDIEVLQGVDPYVEGEQVVKIRHTPTGLTVEFKINIVKNDAYYSQLKLIGFEKSSSMIYYDNNIKTKTNKDAEYTILATNSSFTNYGVGSDNAFKFRPNITLMEEGDLTGDTAISNEYVKEVADIKIELKTGATWTEITDIHDSEYLDSVNLALFEIDFSTAANTKTFRITLTPKSTEVITGAQFNNISLVVDVNEGYNAYTFNDLALLNNFVPGAAYGRPMEGGYAWANRIDMAKAATIKAMYLHNDITITRSMLPAAFNDIDNGIKHRSAIFTHKTPKGEEFVLNGNYFTISAKDTTIRNYTEAVPEIKLFDFNMEPWNQNDENFYINGKNTIKNIHLIGNAPRSNEDVSLKEKGLQGLAFGQGEVVLDNVISEAFITSVAQKNWTYEASGTNAAGVYIGKSNMTISNSKFLDSIALHVYLHTGKLDVINSEFKNANGPVITGVETDGIHDVGGYNPANYATVNGRLVYNGGVYNGNNDSLVVEDGDWLNTSVASNGGFWYDHDNDSSTPDEWRVITSANGRTLSTQINIDNASKIIADYTGEETWFTDPNKPIGVGMIPMLKMGLNMMSGLFGVQLLKQQTINNIAEERFGLQVCIITYADNRNMSGGLVSPATSIIKYADINHAMTNDERYSDTFNYEGYQAGDGTTMFNQLVQALIDVAITNDAAKKAVLAGIVGNGNTAAVDGMVAPLNTQVEGMLDAQLIANIKGIIMAQGADAGTAQTQAEQALAGMKADKNAPFAMFAGTPYQGMSYNDFKRQAFDTVDESGTISGATGGQANTVRQMISLQVAANVPSEYAGMINALMLKPGTDGIGKYVAMEFKEGTQTYVFILRNYAHPSNNS